MKVTVSIPAIVQSMMAGTALGAIGSGATRPALLQPDHEEAMRMAARSTLRNIVLAIADLTDNVNFSAGDIVELELCGELNISPELVAGAIEDAVTARVLQFFYADAMPRASAACAGGAGERTAALRRMLFAALPAPGRIRPHR